VNAAYYYVQRCAVPSDLLKAWEIIEAVVQEPVGSMGRSNSPMLRAQVQESAWSIAQFLFMKSPTATDHQLGVLHNFMIQICTFEGSDNAEDLSKLLSSFRVFCGLREQEIPLEEDYIKIYNAIYFSQVHRDVFLQYLSEFGSTVLKFGDKDLFRQAFGLFRKEYQSRIMLAPQETKAYFKTFCARIVALENDLLATFERTAEPETDKYKNHRNLIALQLKLKTKCLMFFFSGCRCVLELVEDLKREASMTMTPYALRKRNKSRLLEKLLGMNHYSLAAQAALVFEFYSDSTAWSSILKGFMGSGDVAELRKVLVDLRNVSELWMLPEFSEAWRKVSEVIPGFLDLCPIPLD
jgi:hypothetical protein